jgi:hypothetical protein
MISRSGYGWEAMKLAAAAKELLWRPPKPLRHLGHRLYNPEWRQLL